MPSPLAQRRTRSCSRWLMASATPSALRLRGASPKGSVIDFDWSMRNKKHEGLARLIGAVYGSRVGLVTGWPPSGGLGKTEATGALYCRLRTGSKGPRLGRLA